LKQSGLGSIDIIAMVPPAITARVYNDGGSAGTSGFTEEVVTVDQRMRAPQTGVLPYPADAVNFRMNIGVRSFDEGATIAFTTYSNFGALRGVITRTLGPDIFEQFPAASLGQ